jgi:hypothetical protein
MIQSGKQKYLENPVPLPLSQLHVSHGLPWDGIQAYLMTGQRLTARAVARQGLDKRATLYVKIQSLPHRESNAE